MYIKNILEINDLKFKKDGDFDKKFKMDKTEKLTMRVMWYPTKKYPNQY